MQQHDAVLFDDRRTVHDQSGHRRHLQRECDVCRGPVYRGSLLRRYRGVQLHELLANIGVVPNVQRPRKLRQLRWGMQTKGARGRRLRFRRRVRLRHLCHKFCMLQRQRVDGWRGVCRLRVCDRQLHRLCQYNERLLGWWYLRSEIGSRCFMHRQYCVPFVVVLFGFFLLRI